MKKQSILKGPSSPSKYHENKNELPIFGLKVLQQRVISTTGVTTRE